MEVDLIEDGVVGRMRAHLSNIRHPFLLILVVGIILRLLIASFSMGFDADYWAVVLRNIEAGDGLYIAEGYYYTPVWGYVLGLIGALQTIFMDLGEVALRVIEAFPVEAGAGHQTATVTSLALNYSIRIPLMLFDLVTAILIRHLVKDIKGDTRMANLAFALAFLSPVVIGSTGVIGMPDTIAATFSVLAVVLVRRGHSFLAGMSFCMAALTKFFPAFLIFVLLFYVVARYRGDPASMRRHVVSAVAGAVFVAAVIFMPQIIEGNLEQCFQFLTDRTGASAESSAVDGIIGLTRIATYVLALVISFLAGLRVLKAAEADLDRRLMEGCLLVAVAVLIYPPTTQYIVFLVPFLAYWVAAECRGCSSSWKILALGSMVYMFASNSLTMMSLAVWTGLVDVSSLLGFYEMYSSGLGVLTPMNIQFAIGGVLQCVGVLSIPLLMYRYRIGEIIRCRRGVGS